MHPDCAQLMISKLHIRVLKLNAHKKHACIKSANHWLELGSDYH